MQEQANPISPSTRPSFGAEAVRTIVISALLLLAGMFAQYRYNIVGHYLLKNAATSNTGAPFATKSLLTGSDVPSNHKNVDFSIFWEVWDILERDYYDHDKLDAQKMVDGAIGGMTSSLDDPYTAYLPAKAFERTGEDLAGAFFGVGIELGYREGILAAIAPLADSPAQKAGVLAGDLIVRVKDAAKNIDADSSKWSLAEAVDAIRGPKDSEVVLTLVREGKNEPIEVTLKRGEIVVKSAEVEFVEHAGKKVAHIKLSRFGERTDVEWNEVVGEILKQKQGLSGIVLDMRNNPGGLFDEAINIASDFIKDGVVVTQQGKVTKQDFQVRSGGARLAGIPVVVLVNKGSASASEIVAGALRDRLQVPMVGRQTFGKGTVQDRRDLSNGGGVHVTIARWLLPGGSWIHHEGIPVNIDVADDPQADGDEQLLKAIETL